METLNYIPYQILICTVKFGTCVGYLVSYYATYNLFASNIVGTIMGICVVFASFFTISCPYLANLDIHEISYALYILLAWAALIVSFKIADPKE